MKQLATHNEETTGMFNTIGRGFSLGFFAMIAGGIVALCVSSLGEFAAFMPLVPWTLGVILLAVAALIGFMRGRYLGLLFCAAWAAGIGLFLMLTRFSGVEPNTIMETMFRIIPWTFVACCAFGALLNATAP